MEPLLHDPKVQDALSDPRVKQIMQVLKADPEKAQRFVSSSLGASQTSVIICSALCCVNNNVPCFGWRVTHPSV